jgi:NAD(P)H-nitrite reductase large subunit
MTSQSPIIIIGNGIAGTTLARNIRKNSTHPILIISKESDYFFSRTALMYVYMGHLKWEHLEPYEKGFWQQNNINLLKAEVTQIKPQEKIIALANGQHLSYNSLVLATGSTPNKFGWKGQDLEGVQGLYTKQDLEQLTANTPNIKQAVVVGGGLIGIELAEMLHSRGIGVTFLVREDSFWNKVISPHEGDMIEKHILAHGIDLKMSTNLVEIVANEKGQATAIITDQRETLPCQMVGLTAGVRPNIDFLKNSDLEMNRGILVDQHLATNLPDIYAIGDCAELRAPLPHRNAIEAVWYVGRMMGETLAQSLTGNLSPYTPGHWFNSAKFFDIEYQTYGQISPLATQEENHFCWKHPEKNCMVRLAYHPKSRLFLGINTFGIRMRHEVFDQWLNDQTSIETVMENLSQANFDPEFYTQYESQIIAEWQNQFV